MNIEHIEITVENQTHHFNVRPEKIENIATLACRAFSFKSCLLNISFVSPGEIRALNRDYRGKDKVTDVLSFSQAEWQRPLTTRDVASDGIDKFMQTPPLPGVPLHLGDIIIAPEKARENSVSIGQSLERELCFLIVHGLLHLLGHDHQEPEEEQIMLQEQNLLMKLLDGEEAQTPLWKQALCEAQTDT